MRDTSPPQQPLSRIVQWSQRTGVSARPGILVDEVRKVTGLPATNRQRKQQHTDSR